MIYFMDEDYRHVAKVLLDNDIIFKETLDEVVLTLCMAHRVLDGKETKKGRWRYYTLEDNREALFLNSTQYNTDEIIWATENQEHYYWLYFFFLELCQEYRDRFDEESELERKVGYHLKRYPKNLEERGELSFPRTIKFYIDTYREKKRILEEGE